MGIKVKDFATVQMGFSFRSRIEASNTGRLSIIQMKDLSENDTVNCNDLIKIDLAPVKEHHLVKQGDLIFRSRGQTATTAILHDDPGGAIVAAPLLRIRITKPDVILAEYLNWYISQRDAQIYLTSEAKGTVQKMISKQTIEELEVLVPSLEKQHVVVELAGLSLKEHTLHQALAQKRRQYISLLLMRIAKGE